MACDTRLLYDARLSCAFVSDLSALALIEFWLGELLRRGDQLLLKDAGDHTVDAQGWRDDIGFVPGELVHFPCHLAHVTTPKRDVKGSPGGHVTIPEVSNGGGRDGGGYLTTLAFHLPPPRHSILPENIQIRLGMRHHIQGSMSRREEQMMAIAGGDAERLGRLREIDSWFLMAKGLNDAAFASRAKMDSEELSHYFPDFQAQPAMAVLLWAMLEAESLDPRK